MADKLSILSHTTVIDGQRVTIARGDELPSGVKASEVDALRKEGALGGPVADGEPALAATAATPAESEVLTLAARIDGESLNARDTIALAGDDPAKARVVIEAERLASGGDGRATVLDPLAKLAGT